MCFNALWICWTVNSNPLFYTALCTVQCGASNTMQWNTVGQCLVQGTLQQCNKFMADLSYSAPPSTVNSWTSCDASQISEQFTVTSCDASLHLSLGLIGQYALLMHLQYTAQMAATNSSTSCDASQIFTVYSLLWTSCDASLHLSHRLCRPAGVDAATFCSYLFPTNYIFIQQKLINIFFGLEVFETRNFKIIWLKANVCWLNADI